jgi:aspartyl-tRNA synthetase
MLTRSTPEGARDYVVPSRVHPGAFYALPQSPQLFKQLFMVSGFDRYFQIARCFRDEDLRADRQPEFTQIDIEASFIKPTFIYETVEEMMREIYKVSGRTFPEKVPRLTYREAMDSYGTDSPDARYGLLLKTITDEVKDGPFRIFSAAASRGDQIRGLAVPGGARYSRREVDQMEATAKQLGAAGLVWMKQIKGELTGPGAKGLGQIASAVAEKIGLEEGGLALMVAGPEGASARVLGGLRKEIAGRERLAEGKPDAMLWVTDFPLFEIRPEDGRLVSCHHPFTSPNPEDLDYLEKEPERVHAQAYDLVLNGWELGGGSIRIHDESIQRRIFHVLNLTPQESQEKFGFFLSALRFGAPPHGGIALGVDRIVALMTGASSLREVIAFPKTTSATCLMTGSPSFIDPAQMKELHVRSAVPETGGGASDKPR